MNIEDLTLKVERIIEQEQSSNPDIKHIKKSHARLIAQIISNYDVSFKENSSQAAMIFVGAPTGSGKDTLVRKIMLDNPDKDFVVLNMDMFRCYHNAIQGSSEHILDKDFAKTTNQTSYELYYIIQEVILREFPGTNIIITGTMKDLDWVNEIITRYKNDPKTKYDLSLYTLAVPTKESAFSIFERYLRLVESKGDLEIPLRYTDLPYHNATVKDFTTNVQFFEKSLSEGNGMFDTIRVYKRNKDIFDLSEDTLVYDSKRRIGNESATSSIQRIMSTDTAIEENRTFQLLNIIQANDEYLRRQGLYSEIITGLKSLMQNPPKGKSDYDDYSL